MKNEQGNHSRIARLFGDGELLLRFSKSKFWTKLVTKGGKPHLVIINEMWYMMIGMLAYNASVFFRYRYGSRTTGVVMTLSTGLQMIAVNSDYLYLIAKPFYPFFAPVLFFFKDKEYWQMLVFDRIHSQAMMYYILGFAILSFFHTASIYLGFGDKTDPTKRGKSLLHEYVFKYSTVMNEYIIQAAIEPLIVGGVACLFWFYLGDKIFGLYLGMSGTAMLAQEVMDRTYQTRMRMSVNQFE